jgi:hypothetical protein
VDELFVLWLPAYENVDSGLVFGCPRLSGSDARVRAVRIWRSRASHARRSRDIPQPISEGDRRGQRHATELVVGQVAVACSRATLSLFGSIEGGVDDTQHAAGREKECDGRDPSSCILRRAADSAEEPKKKRKRRGHRPAGHGEPTCFLGVSDARMEAQDGERDQQAGADRRERQHRIPSRRRTIVEDPHHGIERQSDHPAPGYKRGPRSEALKKEVP